MTHVAERLSARQRPPLRERALVGVRLFVLAGTAIAAVGAGGHYLGWPLLTATLGPTLYTFLAHPRTETSRLRNAVLGHAAAIGCGLFALAVFGLWHEPALPKLGHATLAMDGAAALALSLTLLLLALLHSHHAPAGATALLVATGIAGPGSALAGLAIGLAGACVLGPLLARLPIARDEAADERS